MMPPQYHSQQPAPYPQVRHDTASASPPIPNGVFQGHPSHQIQRGHTPQPPVPSRPGSRNDMRRHPPNMVPQGVGPHGPHPGITYMPTPPIYNPPANQPNMMPQHGAPYPYGPQQSQPPYMEERRPSAPPTYHSQPPPQPPTIARTESTPPQTHPHQLPGQPMPQISPPPQPERREPQPPPPIQIKLEPGERPKPPLLKTDTAIKKMPQRKSHSIFTPIEENRSILSQHLASFASEGEHAGLAITSRSQSAETGGAIRNGNTGSPHLQNQRLNPRGSLDTGRHASITSLPETTLTPPSRSNSLKIATGGGGTRPRGPPLTLQIPDGGSEPGSATGESNSPRNPAETASHLPQRHNSHSSMVLPPPSPSATALLSAGATGPPNPFARPPPQQNVNGDTPVSALPSRFLNNELLPSPSSFYPEWNFRGNESNTLPSPLNFATPVVGMGPSFLRDEGHSGNHNHGNHISSATTVPAITTTASGGLTQIHTAGPPKRKSPDFGGGGHGDNHDEPKRIRVE